MGDHEEEERAGASMAKISMDSLGVEQLTETFSTHIGDNQGSEKLTETFSYHSKDNQASEQKLSYQAMDSQASEQLTEGFFPHVGESQGNEQLTGNFSILSKDSQDSDEELTGYFSYPGSSHPAIKPSSQTEVKVRLVPDLNDNIRSHTEVKKLFNSDPDHQNVPKADRLRGKPPLSHTEVKVPLSVEGMGSNTEPTEQPSSGDSGLSSITEVKQLFEAYNGNGSDSHTEPKQLVNDEGNLSSHTEVKVRVASENNTLATSLTEVKRPLNSDGGSPGNSHTEPKRLANQNVHATSVTHSPRQTEEIVGVQSDSDNLDIREEEVVERPHNSPSDIPYTFTDKHENHDRPENGTNPSQWTRFNDTGEDVVKIRLVGNRDGLSPESSTEVKRPLNGDTEGDTRPRPSDWVRFSTTEPSEHSEGAEENASGSSSLPPYSALPTALRQGPSSQTSAKEVIQSTTSETTPKEVIESGTSPKPVVPGTSLTSPKEVFQPGSTETSPEDGAQPNNPVRRARRRPPSPHPRNSRDTPQEEDQNDPEPSVADPPDYSTTQGDETWVVERHREAQEAIGNYTDVEGLIDEDDHGGRCGAPKWAIAVAVILTTCIVISVIIVLVYTLKQ